MAQENAEQEPTMEEILASIRRIINEDEEEKPAEAAAPEPAAEPEASAPESEAGPEVEPEPEPEPAFEAEPQFDAEAEAEAEDVLELTDRVEDDEPDIAAVDDDLMIVDREEEEEPAPAPASAPLPEPVVDTEESLVDEAPASAAAGMFAALSENLRVSSDQGQTLEGIVRELMRPMLKQWLDDNLPSIVETQVQAEIERIARRRH